MDFKFISKQYDISKVEIADIGCGYGGLMIN